MNHGTNSCYRHQGCRCDECRAAHKKSGADYYSRNRDAVRARVSQYRSKHVEEHKKNNAEWYLKHRDKVLGRQREYYAAHKSEIEKYNFKYHLEHRDKLAKLRKTLRGKAIMAASKISRRARKIGATGSSTTQQLEWRKEMWGGLCWICGKIAEATDHVIALARGGSNWPANLRPICNLCNSKKRDKDWRLFV